MNDQELAEHLAVETGKVLTKIAADHFAENKNQDLGAVGDFAGHEFLLREFAKHRPLDQVLSEEGEDDLSRLSASRLWIVDPLDGTSHYKKGEQDFAVHIALWDSNSTKPGKISASAISVPAVSSLFGQNSNHQVSELNGPIRIMVSATRPPIEIDLICQSLEKEFPEFQKPQLIPMGSVGAKLGQIISGNADLYINTGGFYEWDIAAPAAVAIANGLKVCDLYGKELEFNKSNVFVPSAVLGKPKLVSAVTEIFKVTK